MDADEYAEDVTDLREAQRMIAVLRRQIEELEPVEGEYWVFLDDEYARMLQLLYDQNKLVYEQDPDLEIWDVFEQFVKDALDLRWDMARAEDEGPRNLLSPRITPSA